MRHFYQSWGTLSWSLSFSEAPYINDNNDFHLMFTRAIKYEENINPGRLSI